MLASAWLAEITGRPAYLAAAETYWDRIYNGPITSWQSQIPDWDNQWWAGNVILLGLTGMQRYQVSTAQRAMLTRLIRRGLIPPTSCACGLRHHLSLPYLLVEVFARGRSGLQGEGGGKVLAFPAHDMTV